MKNSRHSADAEPSVKRSDNTSTSIRINSSLISAPSSHFKAISGETDRSCGRVCVRVEYKRHWMVAGGWRTNSQERDETLAHWRSSCGEFCLLLCCSYLISEPTIIVNSLDFFIKNESLSFPCQPDVWGKLHNNRTSEGYSTKTSSWFCPKSRQR